MTRGFRIFRVAGIDVFIDWSLLIIFFLITLSLGSSLFPSWHPQWDTMTVWCTAAAAAVLFLLSVLIHEFSHALVGRAYGIDIRQITLFIFGGIAHLPHEPHAWRAELWMAIVGPVTSLLLGMACILLGTSWIDGLAIDPDHPDRLLRTLGPLPTLLFWLGPINIVLALFNLVPGFPLDGGRVLRAIVWGVTGDLRVATRWASNVGQAFAWLLIGAGFVMMFGLRVPVFGSGFIDGLWLAFIGWFLNGAALVSCQQLLIREALEQVPVSRLMRSNILTVPPDMLLSTLIDDYLMRSDQRAYPVIENERFIGLVCLEDIRKVARERWERTMVRDVMTPLKDLAAIAPRDDSVQAMLMLSKRGVNQLPVIDRGVLCGMIKREDILKWLSLYGDVSLAQG